MQDSEDLRKTFYVNPENWKTSVDIKPYTLENNSHKNTNDLLIEQIHALDEVNVRRTLQLEELKGKISKVITYIYEVANDNDRFLTVEEETIIKTLK